MGTIHSASHAGAIIKLVSYLVYTKISTSKWDLTLLLLFNHYALLLSSLRIIHLSPYSVNSKAAAIHWYIDR